MDIESIIQGGGCVISGVALAKLIDAAMKAWSARNQRAEVRPQGRPDTFPVDVADKYVTRNEFESTSRTTRATTRTSSPGSTPTTS